ncbi:gene transfer agent family protein [Paracoccus beibuensis]|uniref:gene transfer agent family protein n=1 Tax=Paracoccus beibuensis TaxID=547602 RepID=UPI002240DE57|nr:gene transfer agent family protein [Paracoccus beibuensis]
MANAMRGEVALVLEGQPHVARLTLGALAELETYLGAAGLSALVARIDEGTFGSRDILSVLVAGLRGGGWRGSAQDLMTVQIDGGPLEAARVAARLLALAFRTPA